jgi:hypothetical protein
MMQKEISFWIILSLFSIVFASWLMFHTFSYDAKNSAMLIAPKAWSDFGAHIPLIRSFSLGNNWPPESPLFPGEPIRYHFLFYFLVGMLEKGGLRIDWALNIPSIIGFAGLMMGIVFLAYTLFRDKRIAILSLLFFLCNGSFTFTRFFQLHPISLSSVQDIVTNSAFPSFAPWGTGEIAAFWNLNIYTNQRHLAFAFGLAILFIWILLYIEKLPSHKQLPYLIPQIFILAIMPYFHQPILVILAVFMCCYFILFPRIRTAILFISAISVLYILPQMMPLLSGVKSIRWDPWYLMSPPLTPLHAVWYWIQNLGLHFFLIPLGWIVAPVRIKKITIPLVIVFFIPNLYRFSVDMINNHKFFNFYLIIGSMLTAYLIIKIIDSIKKSSHVWIRYIVRTFVIFILGILTLSGIIDFFPIANDSAGSLVDIPKNADAVFFLTHTKPTDVILNSTWFYHPASIAGRKIFSGYTYFTWSYGYDQGAREDVQKRMHEATTKQTACRLALQYRIAYIEIARTPEQFLKPNTALLQREFVPVYHSPQSGMTVYDVAASCVSYE